MYEKILWTKKNIMKSLVAFFSNQLFWTFHHFWSVLGNVVQKAKKKKLQRVFIDTYVKSPKKIKRPYFVH